MIKESSKPEISLKSLGLTEYEARAYVTLLKYGTLTAEKISDLGSIPLPRVYDTIAELHKKGFVLISKTRPKVFKPLPLDRSLNNYVETQKKDFDKQLTELKKATKDISKEFKSLENIEKTVSEKWNIWSIEKRDNIVKMLIEEERKASKEIIIFAGDFSWLYDVEPSIKSAINKGVKIKAIIHPTKSKDIEKIYKHAKKIGIDVKTGYTGMLRGQIIDQKTAYIASKFSERGVNIIEGGVKGKEPRNRYELVIFDNPAIVDAFREYFNFYWKMLKK